MNEKAIKTLEYDKILSHLTDHAASAAAKEMCRSLAPMDSIDEIRSALKETSDAEMRIIGKGSLSFSGIHDIRAAVKRLEIGSALSASELLALSSLLGTTAHVRNYGRREDRENPDSLEGYFALLEPLHNLKQEIDRCILSEEEIADDASPGLKACRRAIRAAGDKIHTQLNALVVSARDYLQDGVITMRDGRYCLPVRAEHKGNVPGLIHDQSGSGSTYFVEPMAVVKLNNELKELQIREQKEIEMVLADLSNRAAEHCEALLTNYRTLVRLDFIFAKAMLSRSYKGTEPMINDQGYLNIRKGRHPLLSAKHVVPISVWLGKDFSMLIVTGPNTGGKTVTLKTIGLFTLMGQAGLHIPAEAGSSLSVFREVYADIGDEQSIEQSLSTFSAHMTNIVRILSEADEHSLVLFDELGAGTDPVEGAALAMAILSTLRRQEIRTVATTHYSELKLYALSTDGVENACCEFDVATLRPTYRLLIGVPGKSNAFAISGKLGLSPDIIAEARASIGKQDEAFEDLISDLEERRANLEQEQEEAQRLRAEIQKLQSELTGKQQKLNDQRDRMIRDAKEEARRILQDAKNTADKSISSMNKAGVKVGKEAESIRSDLREQINMLDRDLGLKAEKRSAASASEFHIGDAVHVLSMNLNGTVSTLPDAKGNLFVQMGILRSQVHMSDLDLLPEEASTVSKKSGSSSGSIKVGKSLSVSTELNLIGLRVDEAMPILDKYLDDAYLAHVPKVRIIHGRGTGALKQAVQTMLRKNKNVASYRGGEYTEGGYGVTIVEFK